MKLLLVCAAMAAILAAQDRPKFEVASIKQCSPTDQAPPSNPSPGRLRLNCWQLGRLIGDAYDVFATGKVDPARPLLPWPIEGAPAWVNSARYTIDARAEGPQSGAMMRGPMMQVLLEDRFQLKVHHEDKEVEGYVMTVAKEGARLHPTEPGSCSSPDPGDFTQTQSNPPEGKPWCDLPSMKSDGSLRVFDTHGMSLDVFAHSLNVDRAPVINRTGIPGLFDIHLEVRVDDPAAITPPGTASDPRASALLAAIRKQLGLELTPGKGSRSVLVVDHIARPTEN